MLGSRGVLWWAVGCVKLDNTEAGKADPLVSDFPDEVTVLSGHKEAGDTAPDGAVLLMTGNACPVQMFRGGENVYASQFHPEGDAEEFILRIDTYRNHGYFEPHEADELKNNVSLKPTPYAQEILMRFVESYYCEKGL